VNASRGSRFMNVEAALHRLGEVNSPLRGNMAK